MGKVSEICNLTHKSSALLFQRKNSRLYKINCNIPSRSLKPDFLEMRMEKCAFVIRENGEIYTEMKRQDSVIVPSSG